MGDHQDVRTTLEARLATLSERVGKIEENLRKPHSPDCEERAVERENDEVLERLDARGLQEVEQIQTALGRIDDGTYGNCVDCGDSIEARRLEAVPYISTCISCAS
jgi:DnaK suppressor protein